MKSFKPTLTEQTDLKEAIENWIEVNCNIDFEIDDLDDMEELSPEERRWAKKNLSIHLWEELQVNIDIKEKKRKK